MVACATVLLVCHSAAPSFWGSTAALFRTCHKIKAYKAQFVQGTTRAHVIKHHAQANTDYIHTAQPLPMVFALPWKNHIGLLPQMLLHMLVYPYPNPAPFCLRNQSQTAGKADAAICESLTFPGTLQRVMQLHHCMHAPHAHGTVPAAAAVATWMDTAVYALASAAADKPQNSTYTNSIGSSCSGRTATQCC